MKDITKDYKSLSTPEGKEALRRRAEELYAEDVIKNFVPKDAKYTNIPVEIINI